MHLLQRIPVTSSGGEEAIGLYAHRDADGTSFDTYFGAFASSYWREISTVKTVVLSATLGGSGTAELVALADGSETVLHSLTVAQGEIQFPPVNIDSDDSDALFLRVGGCELVTASWSTVDLPARDVHLSAVITTFNRPEYVGRIVEKFDVLATSIEAVRSSFRLSVIDNARNLKLSATRSLEVEVIPNPNLGGAGGFARGLIHARNGGWATHVLFMDDDIAVEPESLVRTLALLRYAKDPMCCVHGAMISEDQPWLCVEAGADYLWESIYPPRPLHHLEDLRDRNVALAKKLDRPYAYSAWWYTAFPLALTKDNPLPVFIRGDDVAWGLMHTRGHIQTLPGIGVWHADFDVKNVPAAVYYEIRNITLASLLTEPGYRWWHFEKRFLGYAFLNLFSMRYLSTEYLLRGMNDFFAGPERLMSTDHAALHGDLYSRDEEKSAKLDAELAGVEMDAKSTGPTSAKEFLLSLLTLGGSIVPAPLRKRSLVAVPVQKRAIAMSIRHNTIVHRHPRQPLGFVARRDDKRFWLLLAQVAVMATKIPFRYGVTARKYKKKYPEMVGQEAWEKSFSRI